MPASLAASARGKPSSAPAIACMRAAAARSFSRRASRRSSSAGRSGRIVSARPPICVLPQPGWTQPESLRPASTQITSESENSRVGIRNQDVQSGTIRPTVYGWPEPALGRARRLGGGGAACAPEVQADGHQRRAEDGEADRLGPLGDPVELLFEDVAAERKRAGPDERAEGGPEIEDAARQLDQPCRYGDRGADTGHE